MFIVSSLYLFVLIYDFFCCVTLIEVVARGSSSLKIGTNGSIEEAPACTLPPACSLPPTMGPLPALPPPTLATLLATTPKTLMKNLKMKHYNEQKSMI